AVSGFVPRTLFGAIGQDTQERASLVVGTASEPVDDHIAVEDPQSFAVFLEAHGTETVPRVFGQRFVDGYDLGFGARERCDIIEPEAREACDLELDTATQVDE